ncbi:nuclear transport factor 2 family protein [Nocardiopsis nanhaiensis]
MNDSDRRLSRLEERLRAAEEGLRTLADEREITRLILSYGPLVDSGTAEAVADLWEQGGVYDVDTLPMEGRDQIAAMVRSASHREWISGGCAHFQGPPHVTVTGDRAVAACYSLMVVHDPAERRFRVHRGTANRWELRRTPQGWRVTRRTSRVLDGRAESPDLLLGALRAQDPDTPEPTPARTPPR